METFQRTIRPHVAFTALALIFGSALIINTPPFQVADEIAHFDRVYSLTQFTVVQKLENGVSGDVLPVTIDRVFMTFRYLSWDPDQKVRREKIGAAMSVPLRSETMRFTRIDAGLYSFLSYLPQLPAMAAGRALSLNVLTVLYMGRFFALVFYVIVVAWALRLIPVGKYLMMCVALFPMSLAQAGSYNADCVLYAVTFLTIALALKSALSHETLRWNTENALLCACLLLMGVLKPVYLPLSLLVLIVRPRRFASWKHYAWLSSAVILGAAALTLVWVRLYSSTAAPWPAGIDPSVRAGQLRDNPFVFAEVLANTYGYFAALTFKGMIGVLGYLDTMLPNAVYAIVTGLTIGVAVVEWDTAYTLQRSQRAILSLVPVASLMGTVLAMFLVTRLEADPIAEGVQGRYLTPLLVPFLAAFSGLLPWQVNLGKRPVVAVLLYLALGATLCVSAATVLKRYFG